MDTGLTTIHEDDIARHLATAQSFVTRMVVMEDGDGRSPTALAGTGRRFVSTVSTGAARRTREVELTRTIQAIGKGDQLLSIPAHTLLFRARRGLAIALAVGDVFAQGSALESLQAQNRRAPLEGADATEAEIQSHIRTRLSAHLVPREVCFVSDLPMTVTGKIIRKELKRRAEVE